MENIARFDFWFVVYTSTRRKYIEPSVPKIWCRYITAPQIILYSWNIFLTGFSSYVGLLYLEHVYRNPIVMTFVGYLLECKSLNGIIHNRKNYFQSFITGKLFFSCRLVCQSSIRSFDLGKRVAACLNERSTYLSRKNARTKWHLAYTLMHNPGLQLYRNRLIKQTDNHSKYKNRNETDDHTIVISFAGNTLL